jgi:hypothetical protein
MSMDQLLDKLAQIRADPSDRAFLLADARDPDMAFGIPSFGPVRNEQAGSGPRYRNVPAFLDEIRAVVR